MSVQCHTIHVGIRPNALLIFPIGQRLLDVQLKSFLLVLGTCKKPQVRDRLLKTAHSLVIS